MKQGGAAPTHANIDVPLAAITLTDMNVGNCPTMRTLGGKLAFEYQL